MAASCLDSGTGILVRGYFVLAVLVGGILGLSLTNAVFVDEMTADNNDRLEQMVSDLREELADNQKSGAADRAEQPGHNRRPSWCWTPLWVQGRPPLACPPPGDLDDCCRQRS